MEVLSKKEAAKFLGVSERTLRRWTVELELPFVQPKKGKRGGRVLFLKKELVDWLNRKQNPPPLETKLEKLKLMRR